MACQASLAVKKIVSTRKGMLTNRCSKVSIDQCQSSCYHTSIIVLFIKLKDLYEMLDEESQKYVDAAKTCPMTPTMCTNPPRKIRQLYKEKFGRSLSVTEGGNTTVFFESMLEASKIPYTCYIMGGDLNELEKKASYELTKLDLLQFRFPDDGLPMSSYKQMMTYIEHKAEEHNIIGGYLGLERIDPSADKHGKHAVSFVVCKTRNGKYKANMCTWGRCDKTSKSVKNLNLDRYDYINHVHLICYNPKVEEVEVGDTFSMYIGDMGETFFKAATVVTTSPLMFDDKYRFLLPGMRMVRRSSISQPSSSPQPPEDDDDKGKANGGLPVLDKEARAIIEKLLQLYDCKMDKNGSFMCIRYPHTKFDAP